MPISLNVFSMENSKNPIASHWQEQPPLKQFLYLFYKWKALAHVKSLLPSAKGLSFYFYVESSSSTFMHHLGEHSCHSEYNVHSPKIYYWLIHDCGIACSKIICIYHPLELEGVLCIYIFLLHDGQVEYHFAMFFYMLKTNIHLSMRYYSWSFVCVTFHVATWLLSSMVKIISFMPMFRVLWSQHAML
jgi:hypothetical protein